MPSISITTRIGAGLILSILITCTAFADTFIVTDRANSGPGTLREAVAAANTTTGQHTITFNISSPGGNSITVHSPIEILNQMTIDGAGSQTVDAPGTTVFAFKSGSENSILRGMAIINSEWGLSIEADNTKVLGCQIGIDWAGNTITLNTYGMFVSGSNIEIGGASVADRNIISGSFFPNKAGLYASRTYQLKIQGNYIGTSADGLSAVENRYGVYLVDGCVQTLIGGNRTAGEGNLISSNRYGVYLQEADTYGNTICGNIFGQRPDQTGDLENISGDIRVVNSPGNQIGLPQSGYENIMGGNDDKITIYSDNNTVQNNLIGINEAGDSFLAGAGVSISGDNNIVGGARGNGLFEMNIISGNNIGVRIEGDKNSVCGNYVGTDATGTSAIGNNNGISIYGTGNLIGGANNQSVQYGNIVSGNTYRGVQKGNIYSGNSIVGNYIGLDVSGNNALPNENGLYIAGGENGENYYGSENPALRNVISGNLEYGIETYEANTERILGNYIGFSADGTTMIPNQLGGIKLFRAKNNIIGGTEQGEGNIICGDAIGISITGQVGVFDESAEGNTLVGNWIGVMPDGTIPTQKFHTGIFMEGDTYNNFIGIPDTGQGNLIAGVHHGIHVTGMGTTKNAFYGNTICSFTGTGILLEDSGNENKQEPTLTYAYRGTFQGTSEPGDFVEVFQAERDANHHGGSLRYVGSATTNTSGIWNLANTDIYGGQYVCAIATDSDNNSSGFSTNMKDLGPTPTPTPYPGLGGVNLNGKQALLYPNPARDEVRFLMHLDDPAEVKIDIYNLVGERIASLEQTLPVGRGQVVLWDCASVAAGIYLVRVKIGDQDAEMHKIAIVK